MFYYSVFTNSFIQMTFVGLYVLKIGMAFGAYNIYRFLFYIMNINKMLKKRS